MPAPPHFPDEASQPAFYLWVEPGHFCLLPYENPILARFEAAVRVLNPVVAVKVRSTEVHAALATVYIHVFYLLLY